MRGFPTETEEKKMPEPVVAEPKPTDPNDEGVKPESTPGVMPEADKSGEEFKSEESKQAVLADLVKERDENKELKARLEKFEQEQQEAEKAKLSDIERAQTEAKEAADEAAQSRRELAVYKLANAKGIQGADDIELLMGIESDEARVKFADRLAATAGPAIPKPDPSQGAKEAVTLTDADKVTAAEKAGDSDAAKRLKAQQLGKLASNL